MLKLMYITGDAALAEAIVAAGVERVFVDLERNGKQERQGHLDTVISDHSLDDARRVRRATPDAELLVRVNPLHGDTSREVEGALAAGADLIMLPMFRSELEVRELAEMIRGRAGIIPLVETPEAVTVAEQVAQVPGVVELYVGLNDLHVALGCNFIFEPLADGHVEYVAEVARRHGIPFGFGGIARLDEGEIPGRMILAEHCRLGSTSVILSRTFYRETDGPAELAQAVFEREIDRLRELEGQLLSRSSEVQARDHELLVDAIRRVARQEAVRQ